MARSDRVTTLHIAPGSPWENGYNESVNRSLRDELLNAKIFYSLAEARVLIEARRRHYTARPHGSLSYRPPYSEGVSPAVPGTGFADHRRPVSPRPSGCHVNPTIPAEFAVEPLCVATVPV